MSRAVIVTSSVPILLFMPFLESETVSRIERHVDDVRQADTGPLNSFFCNRGRHVEISIVDEDRAWTASAKGVLRLAVAASSSGHDAIFDLGADRDRERFCCPLPRRCAEPLSTLAIGDFSAPG